MHRKTEKMIQQSTTTVALVLIATMIGTCCAQFYHQPIAYSLQRDPRLLPAAHVADASQLAHRAVIENSIREQELPPELLKSNRFYSNPRVAAALARDSWFTEKEMPVFDREAEKIPREQVYKIFKNAGFIQRRRR